MAEQKLWAALRGLSERLSKDQTFSASFDRDPSKALRDGGFDITVPATTETSPVRLSDLLQRMTTTERRATIDAIVGNRAERPDRVAVVTPIANANALVNVNAVENANAVTQANALANANANANANTNSNGSGTRQLNPGSVLRVDLDDTFRQTDLARRLGALQLSEARQQALFKSVFSDSMSVVAANNDASGSQKLRAVSTFRGIAFEVEASVKNGALTVGRTRILS